MQIFSRRLDFENRVTQGGRNKNKSTELDLQIDSTTGSRYVFSIPGKYLSSPCILLKLYLRFSLFFSETWPAQLGGLVET